MGCPKGPKGQFDVRSFGKQLALSLTLTLPKNEFAQSLYEIHNRLYLQSVSYTFTMNDDPIHASEVGIAQNYWTPSGPSNTTVNILPVRPKWAHFGSPFQIFGQAIATSWDKVVRIGWFWTPGLLPRL